MTASLNAKVFKKEPGRKLVTRRYRFLFSLVFPLCACPRPHQRVLHGAQFAHQLPLPLGTQANLAEHAAVIKALGKRIVADVIEIGARLTECTRISREKHGHGHWLPWLDREFGWGQSTADRFMKVYDLGKLPNLGNLPDLDLRVSAIYLLAEQSTPSEARDAILDLSANGEHLTHAQVKQMIADALARSGDCAKRRTVRR